MQSHRKTVALAATLLSLALAACGGGDPLPDQTIPSSACAIAGACK